MTVLAPLMALLVGIPSVSTIITLLIHICVIALVVFLIIWVLEQLGFSLPAQVAKILYVIAMLLVVLMILQAFGIA